MKARLSEIIACSFVAVLGVAAGALVIRAIYIADRVHGPSFEGLGVAICGGAAIVLSGSGSLCAFIARKEEKSALRAVWVAARGLNYSVFVSTVAYAIWLVIDAKLKGQA